MNDRLPRASGPHQTRFRYCLHRQRGQTRMDDGRETYGSGPTPHGSPLFKPGGEGELVVTNLVRRAIPRIRIRISDVASVLPYEPCPCGRTHPKMSKVRGRMVQIIDIKGKRFFPIDVEEILGTVPELGYDYQIIIDKLQLDRLKLKVEYRSEIQETASLARRVEEGIHRGLGVESEVELVPKGSIGRVLFKAQRVITTYPQR